MGTEWGSPLLLAERLQIKVYSHKSFCLKAQSQAKLQQRMSHGDSVAINTKQPSQARANPWSSPLLPPMRFQRQVAKLM